MIVFGGFAAVIGVVLFHTALGRTLRANPANRVPFYRSPQIVPAGTIPMRATGAGLIVLGAGLLGTSAWYWALVIVLVSPVVALAVMTVHTGES